MAMAMATAGQKIHILAIPLPFSGHITALLQLCRILTTSNSAISVTFLNTHLYNQTLFQNISPKESFNITFASLEFADSTASEHRASLGWGFFRAILASIDELEAPTRRFVSAKLERKPDFLLCDVYIGWAQDMAAQLGIPRIALWTSSASECLVYHYAPNLIARSILPFKVPEGCNAEEPDSMVEEMRMENPPTFHQVAVGSEDDIVVDIPGLPPLHRGEFPSLLQVEDGDDIIFYGYIKLASRMAEADIVLLNTFYELETRVIQELKKEMRAAPIGPLFLMDELHEHQNKEMAMEKEGGRECLEWLDGKLEGSVLYVAFGSELCLLESQVGEIAAGLEACGKSFLWSLKTGSAPPPKGFIERCKGRGKVVSWAPQTLVLGHPSIGAFLSHCGWNSSLESISLGVPLICCPRTSDQILNAKMIVEEWGLGLAIATTGNFLTAEGLAFAVEQLLDGESASSFELKARGRAIKAKARALQHVVSKAISSTSNVTDATHSLSSRQCLHSLLQYIGSHGSNEQLCTEG